MDFLKGLGQLIKSVSIITGPIAGHIMIQTSIQHPKWYTIDFIQGWQFNLGDVVTVSVDFDKSKVIFKRDSDIYEQPIKTDLGPIYAFVGPTNLGDTF